MLSKTQTEDQLPQCRQKSRSPAWRSKTNTPDLHSSSPSVRQPSLRRVTDGLSEELERVQEKDAAGSSAFRHLSVCHWVRGVWRPPCATPPLNSMTTHAFCTRGFQRANKQKQKTFFLFLVLKLFLNQIFISWCLMLVVIMFDILQFSSVFILSDATSSTLR